MSTKTLFNSYVALAAVLIFSAVIVNAASKEDIAYPVAELGGCESESECRSWCENRDSAQVIRACLAFAKKHNLLPAEVIARGEKFSEVAVKGGPGGCKNETDCIAYCENVAHIQECVEFAEKYNLLPEDELAEAKNVAKALQAGAKLPGECTGKEDCIAYCENPAHIDECLEFAEKTELIPPQELAEAKKFAPYIKSGQTPGGCKTKQGCENYCENAANREECVNFGVKVGIISEKEAEFLRKTGFRGPGDCNSKKKCADFCNDPANHQTCLNFAVEQGFLTAEETAQLGSLGEFQACLPQADEELTSCLEENLGEDLFHSLKEGVFPSEPGETEEAIKKIRRSRNCIQDYTKQSSHQLEENPQALRCLKTELGEDIVGRLSSGKIACGEISRAQEKIARCLEGALKDEIKICLALPCDELFSCTEKLQKKGGGEREGQKRDAQLEARITACTSELKSKGGDAKPESKTESYYPAEKYPASGGEYQYKTDCSVFELAPTCSYVGSEGSEYYKLCKACFPER